MLKYHSAQLKYANNDPFLLVRFKHNVMNRISSIKLNNYNISYLEESIYKTNVHKKYILFLFSTQKQKQQQSIRPIP